MSIIFFSLSNKIVYKNWFTFLFTHFDHLIMGDFLFSSYICMCQHSTIGSYIGKHIYRHIKKASERSIEFRKRKPVFALCTRIDFYKGFWCDYVCFWFISLSPLRCECYAFFCVVLLLLRFSSSSFQFHFIFTYFLSH